MCIKIISTVPFTPEIYIKHVKPNIHPDPRICHTHLKVKRPLGDIGVHVCLIYLNMALPLQCCSFYLTDPQ